jgi:putative (di)nucleoside polyphosphate hydrolase
MCIPAYHRFLQVIDAKGYRANVGIILSNDDGKVFWARRCGQDAWQFPQGGIQENETPLDAMYRELNEETGLQSRHVRLVGQTDGWLRYRIPRHLLRHRSQPLCIGQKQIWFRLQLIGGEEDFNLSASDTPEFDTWRWVDYWTPLKEIVFFKRKVYRQALRQLERCGETG